MWGPGKDFVKEGFSVSRQAEQQQPVYHLILLCVPKLVAASCKAPLRSFPSAPTLHVFLTFLAGVTNMEVFLHGLMNALTLLFRFCYTLCCIFVLPVLFSPPWHALNIIVTRGISHFHRLLLSSLAVFILGGNPNIFGSFVDERPGHCPKWICRGK